MHVVFDISGVIDVEPFLIQTGFAYADLALPAGAELIAVQIPVWDGLALRGATLAAPIYAVRFDAQWVDWLYYLLLEARNNGADPFDALASDRAFGAITHDAAHCAKDYAALLGMTPRQAARRYFPQGSAKES